MSLVLQSSGGGQITIQEPATASNFTQTLPAATGNVVLDSATQTLTNKTIQGGAITSGTAVASTSGTSIDFTSIPSWVKRITVMFQGVSTNGTSTPQIQVGSGSFTTTGYNSCGSVNAGTTVAATTNSTTGFILGAGGSSGDVRHGSAVLTLLGSNNWTIAGVFGYSQSNVSAFFGGSVALGGTLDRIRITTVNGTDAFDAGTINILYE